MEEKVMKNIYQRILGVMGDLDYIQKGDKRVNNQYKYVSHDQVSAAVHPLLVKHGIAVIPNVTSMKQDGNRTEIVLEIIFVNADMPEQQVKITYPGFGIDNSDKGIGKAISYAFKYAILKTFVLETGDDPDHDQDTVYEPQKEALGLTDKQVGDVLRVFTEYPEYGRQALDHLKEMYGDNPWKKVPSHFYERLMNGYKKKAKDE